MNTLQQKQKELIELLQKDLPIDTALSKIEKYRELRSQIAELEATPIQSQTCKCGNVLTEKELYYETCLHCNDVVISEQ